MEPYQHFQLVRPPFGLDPDPRVFYAAPWHREALATLEYAVHARKHCAVVVGDAGAGKTLLARLTAARVSPRHVVLWVQGAGQSSGDTECHLFAAGALSLSSPEPPVAFTTLNEWMRAPQPRADGTLVIVDDAEELPDSGWSNIILALARAGTFGRRVSVLLFGAPGLVNRLAWPGAARLRRRVFRTCVLGPLDESQVVEYVSCRLAAAGLADGAIFEPEALRCLYAWTRGNPGLINQLADNALIEAFSQGHPQISPADVTAGVNAIVGALHVLAGGSGGPALASSSLPALSGTSLPSEGHDAAHPPLRCGAVLGEPVALASPPLDAPESARAAQALGPLGHGMMGIQHRLSRLESRLRNSRARACANREESGSAA